MPLFTEFKDYPLYKYLGDLLILKCIKGLYNIYVHYVQISYEQIQDIDFKLVVNT